MAEEPPEQTIPEDPPVSQTHRERVADARGRAQRPRRMPSESGAAIGRGDQDVCAVGQCHSRTSHVERTWGLGLSRHFPTRAALIEAAYRRSGPIVRALGGAVEDPRSGGAAGVDGAFHPEIAAKRG